MSEELKPCPFCGGKAEVSRKHPSIDDMYRVSCENRFIGWNCPVNMRTHNCDSEYTAIDLWNTRTQEEE